MFGLLVAIDERRPDETAKFNPHPLLPIIYVWELRAEFPRVTITKSLIITTIYGTKHGKEEERRHKKRGAFVGAV